MKYLKQRRIKKLKIKIAGLEAEAEILRQLLIQHEHRQCDRDRLISVWSKRAELKEELDILSDNVERTHR